MVSETYKYVTFGQCGVGGQWSNYLNPANIKGLSVFTVLLAMAGNGLLLPRALFTRDLMWYAFPQSFPF